MKGDVKIITHRVVADHYPNRANNARGISEENNVAKGQRGGNKSLHLESNLFGMFGTRTFCQGLPTGNTPYIVQVSEKRMLELFNNPPAIKAWETKFASSS